VCRIIELVRTVFTTAGDEEVPARIRSGFAARFNNFQFFFGGIQFRIREANTKIMNYPATNCRVSLNFLHKKFTLLFAVSCGKLNPKTD